MRQLRVPFLVVAFSLLMAGMAFAIDLPTLTSWGAGGVVPGLAIPAGGRGDVLLGPFYDCRNLTDTRLPGAAGTTAHAQQTLIALVNTDHVNGVVGRLRFREWKRSFEVLDLDIPLSANDVWVGVVSRAANGGCVLTSPDLYVTNIVDAAPFPSNTNFTAGPFPAAGFAFNPLLIADEATPAAALARTEYGEFEFIGEEIVTYAGPELITNITLTRKGIGVDRHVGNVLEGTVFIIRPDIAISHQYNMTAISNFSINPNGIYNSPLTSFPNLCHDVQGAPICGGGGNPGAGGFDNLEALLSKRFVDFQYVTGTPPVAVDPSQTPTSTSAVITFPTKTFHYATTKPFAPIAAYPFLPPFTGAFEALGDGTGAGEVVGCFIWDRLENLLSSPQVPISPAGVSGVCNLPYEVNVVGMYPVAGASPEFRNNLALSTASGAFTFYSGWARIDLSPPFPTSSGDSRTVNTTANGGIASGAGFREGKQGIVFSFFNNVFAAYQGLPTLGLVMTEFYNGAVSGYFGNTVPVHYGVDWSNATIPFLTDPAAGGVSPLNPGYPF